ncbi:hypothetical protein ACHAW6_007913 [Cyclotella cf. meneghiniana]
MMSVGSYNEKISQDLCSCTVNIYCKKSGNKATIIWVYKSISNEPLRGNILLVIRSLFLDVTTKVSSIMGTTLAAQCQRSSNRQTYSTLISIL